MNVGRSVGLSNGWVSLSSIYSVLIKNCITPTVITIYGDCRDICAPGGRDADRMNDGDDDYCSLWRMKFNSIEWTGRLVLCIPFLWSNDLLIAKIITLVATWTVINRRRTKDSDLLPEFGSLVYLVAFCHLNYHPRLE